MYVLGSSRPSHQNRGVSSEKNFCIELFANEANVPKLVSRTAYIKTTYLLRVLNWQNTIAVLLSAKWVIFKTSTKVFDSCEDNEKIFLKENPSITCMRVANVPIYRIGYLRNLNESGHATHALLIVFFQGNLSITGMRGPNSPTHK